ncbi:hypothetical protein V6N12_007669 [Hibiscus sabdariffa]|uniref:Uncharacterized protein n=1 Tax=Hibiscus sabdariffa TaxID=183260 RepID=A0ABR2F2H9_9ROSI
MLPLRQQRNPDLIIDPNILLSASISYDEMGKYEREEVPPVLPCPREDQSNSFFNRREFGDFALKYDRVNYVECRNQLSMLRLYLCKGLNNLLEQDDKGDVSAETTGPAPTEVSAGIQISAERRAVLLAYP